MTKEAGPVAEFDSCPTVSHVQHPTPPPSRSSASRDGSKRRGVIGSRVHLLTLRCFKKARGTNGGTVGGQG